MKRSNKTAARVLSFVLSVIMAFSTFMTDFAIANASEIIEETSESSSDVAESADVEESSEEESEAAEESGEGEETEATESEEVEGEETEATEGEEVEGEDTKATESEEVEGEDTEATEDEGVVEGEEELTEEELLEEEIVEIVGDIIKISFKASEGGSVSMPEQTLGEEDEVEAVTATADEGYEFVNWTKDGEEVSTSEEFTPAKEEATYVANFEEVEEEELEFNQSKELDGMKISLYAKPGVLPNDAELQVKKVSTTLEKEIKETIDNETEETVEETISFDINIYSASAGEYVQPEDGTVSVTFELLDVDTEDKEVSVYHVEETGSSVSAVEEVAAPVENADEVVFDAEHFSVYTVVITTGNKNETVTFYVNQVDETHKMISGEEKIAKFDKVADVNLSNLKKKIATPTGYTYGDKAYVTIGENEIEIMRLRYNNGKVEYSIKESGNKSEDWSDLDEKTICFHYSTKNLKTVYFYLLKPNKTVPSNASSQPMENYFPADSYFDSNYHDWQGTAAPLNGVSSVYGENNVKGYLRSIPKDDINKFLEGNPTLYGDYVDVEDIAWYVYKNTGFEYHIDGYMKNLPVDVTYYRNYPGINDTVTWKETSQKTGEYVIKQKPEDWKVDGYTFAGWASSKNATSMEYSENSKYTLKTATVFYAVWKSNSYPITYDLDGGVLEEGQTNPTSYTKRDTFTLNNPIKEGYEFKGWTGTGLTEPTLTVKVTDSTGERKYKAIWSPIEYTVLLSKGTGIASVSGNGTYSYGQTVTVSASLLQNTAQYTYSWQNWTGTGVDTSNEQTYTFTMPAHDVVLIANGTRTENVYKQIVQVSYENADGTFTEYEDVINKNYVGGDTVEWSRPADEIYQAASIEPYTVTGAKTTKVTVYRNRYTVTLIKGTGIAEVTGAGTYKAGQNVTVAATLLPGYEWSNWTSENTQTYTIDGITEDVEDTAYAKLIDYTITYNLDGGTVDGTNPETYTVETETFTLNNPTKAGYTFAGWIGTGLDDATENVTVAKGSTGNREYTANWTAIEYTVTYQLNGGNVGGKTEDVVYEKLFYGQSYAENAPAPKVTRTGEDGVTYFFDGWKVGDNFVDLNGKTVTEDATYTAQWVEVKLIATGKEVTYDGNAHGIEVEKSDNVAITGYVVNGITSPDAPTYVNVSENEITVKGEVELSDGTVETVTADATVTIYERPITVQFASVTKSYSELRGRSINVDDIPTPRFSLTAGELASGDTFDSANITLAVEDDVDGVNKTQGVITLASGSSIIIKSAIADVSANYDITVVDGNAQVTDTTKTVITLTANSDEFTYNAAEQTVSGYTATIAGNALENYTVSGVTAEAKGTNAGEYDVTFSYDNDGYKVTDKAGKDVTKYFSIETVNGKLTINKANLTITATSAEKVYDGTALQGGYSVEGLQGTDTVTSIKYKKAWSWQATSVAPSIITPGTVNYSVQDAVISDGRTENYNITYVDGTLKVTEADIAITVKANDNTATYDGGVHLAGFVNGKQYSITSGELLSGDYIVGAYVTGGARDVSDNGTTMVNNVRIYHADGTDVTDCYNVTKENGKVTINARPITITVNSASKVYDGTELVAPVDASTGKAYKITSGSLAGYYAEGFGFTDAITKADVTGSILYPGTVNSTIDKDAIEIGVESDGFLGGILDTVLGYILNRTNLQSNYDITVVDGTLEITTPNPVALTVTANGNSKVYDGTELTAAVGEDGKAYTVSGTLYPNHVLEATVAGTRTNAGGAGLEESTIDSYTIMCGNDDVSRFYEVTTISSDLAVSQRPIMVVANDATKAIYDGIPFTTDDMLDENGVGFKVLAVEGNADSGLLEGHTVAAEISVDENLTVSKESATHVANAVVADSDVMLLSEESLTDNYAITYADGNAVVHADDKLDVTLTANSGTYTYTGGAFAVDGYTVAGPEGFDVTGLTFDNVAAGATATTVGSYTVSFAYADADGNELTEENVVITDAYGNNVTEYFTITYVDGLLRINAQPSGGGSTGGGGGRGGRSTADVGRVLGARREDIAVIAEEGQVLGAVRAPKTSDSSRAILWMLVMGTSALGAAAILAQKKNEEEN